MIIMKIVTDIFSAFIQLLIISTFFSIYGKKIGISRKIDYFYKILFITISAIATIFIKVQIVFTIVIVFIISMYSMLYKMKLNKRTFSILFICILLIISEMIFGLLFTFVYKCSIEETQINILIYLQVVLFSELSIYVLMRILKKFSKKKDEAISSVMIITFIFMPISTFIVLYILSKNVYLSNVLSDKIFTFIAAVLLIVSNIIVFLTFDYIILQKQKEKDVEKRAVLLEYENKYYKDLSDKQRLSNKTLHDVKNKAFAIKALMDTNLYAAKDEIDKICDIVGASFSTKITGIVAIDELLSSKKKVAIANNVTINITSYIPEKNNFDVIDLCVILGNLLDNSIDACMKIQNNQSKIIDLEIKQNENYLSIMIVNDTSDAFINGNNLETTKINKHLHGFGLNNVKELCKKSNGDIKIVVENNKFKVNVILEEME